MSSIGVEIAKLSNPTPQFSDIDDHEYTESLPAQFENEHKNLFQRSKLRSRTAPLLEDIDETYSGRKVTRKSKGLVFEKGNVNESKVKIESEFSESDSDIDEDEVSDEDDGLSEDGIASFKKDLENKSSSEAEESTDQGSDSESEEAEKDDMVSQFANIDVNSEIEKGNAIKAQQEIWNKLCECRIKLQKLLIVSNKLPQTSSWLSIRNKIGEEVPDIVSKGNDSVKSLLNSLMHLKQELGQSTEKEIESVEEMEIPSDSDEEHETQEVTEGETNMKKGVKRKYKNENYSDILSKQFEIEKAFRNSIIQKWDEKVRLSTGRMTQKSFNAFDNSAVKQIEQILQDRTRLIKRTQLKRSVYRVLGKPEFSELKSNESNIEDITSKQDLLLKDYDPQIFDDDDFYRQLLKDIIQSKSIGIDPSIVRKQMELQKIRNKMKRKVDTKASKGRKLRYDVHPKLVNYMAPLRSTTMSDEARENLMKCLFGRNLIH
ncbi:protein AATF [Parasteatoda tepidariorum]|uniref:protein AATF n=1 Tax=Parasteatoda tepidariorum TaxID=114398 RepID=UPI00077FDE95|nr:protein AATF [Parasteatoda tepidariorum]